MELAKEGEETFSRSVRRKKHHHTELTPEYKIISRHKRPPSSTGMAHINAATQTHTL